MEYRSITTQQLVQYFRNLNHKTELYSLTQILTQDEFAILLLAASDESKVVQQTIQQTFKASWINCISLTCRSHIGRQNPLTACFKKRSKLFFHHRRAFANKSTTMSGNISCSSAICQNSRRGIS